MLSNAHFLAKFRFDTAENEPAKNLQKNAKFNNFANSADPNPLAVQARMDLRTLADPAMKIVAIAGEGEADQTAARSAAPPPAGRPPSLRGLAKLAKLAKLARFEKKL